MKSQLAVFAAASMTAAVAAWTTPPPAYDYVVRVTENAFNPERLEVNFGDKVIWKNFDIDDHTVTAQFWPAEEAQDRPYFDSGVIRPGDSFDFTFVKEGTYRYICKFHQGIVGTVIVRR